MMDEELEEFMNTRIRIELEDKAVKTLFSEGGNIIHNVNTGKKTIIPPRKVSRKAHLAIDALVSRFGYSVGDYQHD